MRTQEDLIRTLRAAADHAEPDPALATAVAARRRVRRRGQWLRVTLAAAAVVLVAGGTTAVLSGRGEPPRPAATRGVEPVAQVWPEAVFAIPGTAADGREYLPMAAISPAEVLVAALAPGGGPDRLEVFDTGTRVFRKIGDMPKPKVEGYSFRDVKAGEKHIVWWGGTPDLGSGGWADFWYVPRAGGETVHLAKVTGALARVDGIDVTEDHLVFSVEKGGVFRIPLTGGEPEKMAGTDGLHLLAWPTAAAHTSAEPYTQKSAVDLTSGRTVALPAPPDARGFACGSRWCAGTGNSGAFSQRLDGADRRTLPERLQLFAFRGLLADRFVFGRPAAGPYSAAVYDLETGRLAGLGDAGAGFGFGVPLPTVLHWGDRRERTVVNLLAVR